MTRLFRHWLTLPAALAISLLGGCFPPPNPANVKLRKENQDLTQQVQDLQRTNDGLKAQIAADEARNKSLAPRLPQSRLDQLFTAHGLQFGKLTGGWSADGLGPDKLVKVDVVPTDDDGQPLKAAGSFKVELFDLGASDARINEWRYSTADAKGHWYGRLFYYSYIFDCPLDKPPAHANLHVRVTFTDELTGRTFTAERDITIRL